MEVLEVKLKTLFGNWEASTYDPFVCPLCFKVLLDNGDKTYSCSKECCSNHDKILKDKY